MISRTLVTLSRRCAATLVLLGVGAPAMAQWTTNPIVDSEPYYEAPTASDRCRFELDGCAFVVHADGPYLRIEHTDTAGLHDPDTWPTETTWITDPLFAPQSGTPRQHQLSGVVGCVTGSHEFMLAYNGSMWGVVPPTNAIRITKIAFSLGAASGSQFVVQPGYPRSISNENGFDLAITPNRNGVNSGGAIVAWYAKTTAPAETWIRQQGINGSNSLMWTGTNNGVLVDPNGLGTTGLTVEPPSIVSTEDGLAFVTYHAKRAGVLQHWTAKVALSGPPAVAAQLVPGQVSSSVPTESKSRCCVASDGVGGAFYGFATERMNTTLVASHLSGAGAAAPWLFWDSLDGGGPGGTREELRALSFLAMPGQSGLFTYRDMTGIRCIKYGWSAATPTQLNFSWTHFVRGATQNPDRGDDAASALCGDKVCVMATSDQDVTAIEWDVNGVYQWQGRHNDPALAPAKQVYATMPRWPHIFALSGTTPGYMLAWYDYDADDQGYWIAERIRLDGTAGKTADTGLAGSNHLPGSAVLWDTQSPAAFRVKDFEFALAEPAGTNGTVDVYSRPGSFVGHESSTSGWTLVASGSVVCAGPGARSKVTLGSSFVVPAGTNALLLRGNGVALGSSPASGSGLVFDCGDLVLQCGAHVANWPAGAVQAGRVFQGGMAYESADLAQPAAHIPYGSGCYGQSDSFHLSFADAAVAAPALTGRSMTMIPVAAGQYAVVWDTAAYVAPSGASSVLTFAPNNDDGVVTVALSAPFPTPSGAVTTLHVHSNGNVWTGDNSVALSSGYTPSTADLLNAPHLGWWSWHDYDPSEPGSGPVRYEEIGGTCYITWDGVESYPSGVANPGTMQFQFDTTTGTVSIVWAALASDASSLFGSAHVVGYSPGGPSFDGGNLAAQLGSPFQTLPGMSPLTLAASPAPIFTVGGPSVPITYTVTNVPDAAPPFGIGIGLLAFSVAPAPGIDLGFVGAPGCSLNIASFDVVLSLPSSAPTSSLTLAVPQPLAAGLSFWSQAIALFPPGSLPNGQNAFGALTSNGLQSRFGLH